MKRDSCEAIAALWIQLNPHAQVHGCEIRDESVFIYILYRREGKNFPLELCLGNPASTVLRGLRQAVNAEARTKRLTTTGSRLIRDNKPAEKTDGEKIIE